MVHPVICANAQARGKDMKLAMAQMVLGALIVTDFSFGILSGLEASGFHLGEEGFLLL